MNKTKLLLIFASISFNLKSINIYFTKPNFNNNDAFIPNYVTIAWEDSKKQNIPGSIGVKEGKIIVPKNAKSFKLFFSKYQTKSIEIIPDEIYDPNKIFAEIIRAANNSRKRSFLQMIANEAGMTLVFGGAAQENQDDNEYFD